MTEATLTEQLLALLRERSVSLGSFVLSSGKTSTYYIDARRTTMSASGLSVIGALGVLRIHREGWETDAVGGLTLGADPVAYAIARESADGPAPIDAFTVRKKAKVHGQRRRIEGIDLGDRRVVVVEDVITTGGSALEALEVVLDAGATVVGVLAVVDREEGGRESIERRGVSVASLATATALGLTPTAP